jgi:hypothetical protein
VSAFQHLIWLISAFCFPYFCFELVAFSFQLSAFEYGASARKPLCLMSRRDPNGFSRMAFFEQQNALACHLL